MHTLLKILLSTIIILVSSPPSISANDKQSWVEFKIKRNISKIVAFDIAPQIRFKNDATRAHWSQINISLSKKINSHITIIPAYQHIRYEETNIWKTEYRPNFSIALKQKTKSLDLGNKNRIDYRIKENIKTWRYRNKFTLKFPLKKTGLTPGIAGEAFYDFSAKKINKYRMYYGIAYRIFKGLETSFTYLSDTDYKKNINTQKWTWQKTNIFFVTLNFSV